MYKYAIECISIQVVGGLGQPGRTAAPSVDRRRGQWLGVVASDRGEEGRLALIAYCAERVWTFCNGGGGSVIDGGGSNKYFFKYFFSFWSWLSNIFYIFDICRKQYIIYPRGVSINQGPYNPINLSA